ncbi:MAG: alpha/beta hydrolase [Pirellulaceae bacterium]
MHHWNRILAHLALLVVARGLDIATPLAICEAQSISQSVAQELASEIARPIRAERDLTFRRVAGESITADMFRPDDDASYPLVIVIHGGAWSAGNKWQVRDHARELAQAGFVAVAINYRLAPAHPLSEQVDDCRAGLVWAASQADQWKADATRVCLWGYSAGGHLASLLATDPQPGEPPICAVVAGGAPCDFEFLALDSPGLVHVFGGTRADPRRLFASFPIEHVTAKTPPFFLFHGESDALVPRHAASGCTSDCAKCTLKATTTWFPNAAIY